MRIRFLTFLILTLSTLGAQGDEIRGKRLWKWSVGVLAATNAADTMSSIGRYDRCAISDPAQAPAGDAQAAFVNFAMRGATAGVAALNSRH